MGALLSLKSIMQVPVLKVLKCLMILVVDVRLRQSPPKWPRFVQVIHLHFPKLLCRWELWTLQALQWERRIQRYIGLLITDLLAPMMELPSVIPE